MRRAIGIGLLLAGLAVARPAEANILCRWFGYCVYESPGFRFTVVDKETGRPLADVHALAEWQSYAMWGRNGPLMVQDAVSGRDGLLTFSAWGPIRGYRDGLVLNHDPVITLLKPGYKASIIFNVPGTDETERVRGFREDGQTFGLEPFRGTPDEWVEQLDEVWSGRAFPRDDEQTLKFRDPYLNRVRRVWAERDTVPERQRSRPGFFGFVERAMRFLEEGHR